MISKQPDNEIPQRQYELTAQQFYPSLNHYQLQYRRKLYLRGQR